MKRGMAAQEGSVVVDNVKILKRSMELVMEKEVLKKISLKKMNQLKKNIKKNEK